MLEQILLQVEDIHVCQIDFITINSLCAKNIYVLVLPAHK